ncbi:MAG: T9SS type A sorting domain-containing protein [Bacteroidaceae bacterium]|nr:T9SS type A sorting domain-containing protein [Bacteroidaceae bacterium]
MNKLFFTLLLLFSTTGLVKAQLKVNSSGSVGIGDNPTSTSNLYIKSLYYDGIDVSATAESGSSGTGISVQASSSVNSSSLYGVQAYANGATLINVGVLGRVIQNGAAILGTVQSGYSFTLNQPYAGYFYGNVQTTGSLSSTGGISGTFLSSAPSYSATRSTTSAQPLELTGGASRLISGLTAQTFYQDQTRLLSSKAARNQTSDSLIYLSENELPLSTMEEQVLTKQHYGLDAEQLEAVFPDLVYENEDGSKSINYVEMVPILVQAINELQSQVNELKAGQEGAVKKATGISDTPESVQLLSLSQNKPNPFSTATDIEVSVPETVQTAILYIYDLQGKKVQQVDINARGKQTVRVDGADLAEGMYLYSLIADGKVVETRRMIVEK